MPNSLDDGVSLQEIVGVFATLSEEYASWSLSMLPNQTYKLTAAPAPDTPEQRPIDMNRDTLPAIFLDFDQVYS